MDAAKAAVDPVKSGRSRGRMVGMVGGGEGPDGLGEVRVEDDDASRLMCTEGTSSCCRILGQLSLCF